MPVKLTNKSWISLIKSGINPTDYLFDTVGPTNCDKNGNTLLHYAANFGDHDLCKVLLSEGWFVLNKNLRGESALDFGISYPRVRELLEAHVKLLPSQVLDYALSSPPQILKQQARSNWQAIASPHPESLPDREAKPPEEEPEKLVSETPLDFGDAMHSFAHKLVDHGYFLPVGVTKDPDAADWNLPEELVLEGGEMDSGKILELISSRLASEDEDKIDFICKELEAPKLSIDLAYRSISSRVSTILLLVRVFSCLLNDGKHATELEGSPVRKIVTDQDNEDYGNSIYVMRRVFEDEVRIFREELLEQWASMSRSLAGEIESLAKLLSAVASMNFSPRVTARQVVTSEEYIDYGDSINVMSRVFSEKLASTDCAISNLKADLIEDIAALNLEISILLDAIDEIKSFSIDGSVSIVTKEDLEDYGESIDIMSRVCRAELSVRVSVLRNLFQLIAN